MKLLFEGLTRYNQKGNIENALPESIEISSDLKQYIFKLRSACGTMVLRLLPMILNMPGKRLLSPDFKTAFAYLFYPIKNAKEAKEGKVSAERYGINAFR